MKPPPPPPPPPPAVLRRNYLREFEKSLASHFINDTSPRPLSKLLSLPSRPTYTKVRNHAQARLDTMCFASPHPASKSLRNASAIETWTGMINAHNSPRLQRWPRSDHRPALASGSSRFQQSRRHLRYRSEASRGSDTRSATRHAPGPPRRPLPAESPQSQHSDPELRPDRRPQRPKVSKEDGGQHDPALRLHRSKSPS